MLKSNKLFYSFAKFDYGYSITYLQSLLLNVLIMTVQEYFYWYEMYSFLSKSVNKFRDARTCNNESFSLQLPKV